MFNKEFDKNSWYLQETSSYVKELFPCKSAKTKFDQCAKVMFPLGKNIKVIESLIITL